MNGKTRHCEKNFEIQKSFENGFDSGFGGWGGRVVEVTNND